MASYFMRNPGRGKTKVAIKLGNANKKIKIKALRRTIKSIRTQFFEACIPNILNAFEVEQFRDMH